MKDNNQPLYRSVIHNTTYENYGYVYTHMSMGKDTVIVPERLKNHAFYFGESGTVDIEYKEDGIRKIVRIRQGDVIIRRAGMLCGFRAIEDTVVSELVFPKTSKTSTLLVEGLLMRLENFVSYKSGDVNSAYLIDDINFKLYVDALDKGTMVETDSAPCERMFTILEGTGIVAYKYRESPINKGETFVVPRGRAYRLTATERMKLVVSEIIET